MDSHEKPPVDPDENLWQQLKAAKAIEAINENPDGCAEEDVAYHGLPLAKLVQELDDHLAAGGIPPKRWTGKATETRGAKMQDENTRLRTAIEKVLPVLEKEYRHLAVERDFDGEYDGVPREEIPDAWPVRILKEALAGK